MANNQGDSDPAARLRPDDPGRPAEHRGAPGKPVDLVVTDEVRAAGTDVAGDGPHWAPPPMPVPQSLYYREIAPRPYEEGEARAGRPEPAPSRRAGPSLWTVVLVLAALAGGVTIGLAYKGSQTPATSAPVAEETTEPFEITVTIVADEGSLVRLSWTDPTDGEAVFVISQTTPQERLLRDTPRGDTEAVIDGLDPAVPRYCFRVLAILDAQTTASATACTPIRG